MPAPGGRARWGATLRSTWFKVTAALTAAAALGAGALLSSGYDTAQTKVDDSSVWVLRQNGQEYARVDARLGEIDTVKGVQSPTGLVQAAGHVLLYSQTYAQVAAVDLAQPADYTRGEGDDGMKSTPEGTTDVVSTGDFVGYRSSTGAVSAARIEQAATSNLPTIDDPGQSGHAFAADTMTIGEDGVLYAYSHTSKTVLRFDIATGRTLGADAVADGPAQSGATITAVGDTWALLAPDGGQLWLRGRARPVQTALGDRAVLQQPSGEHPVVVIATETGLETVDLKTGAHDAPGGTSAAGGVPAAPAWHGGKLYAAWLAASSSAPGQLWQGSPRIDGTLRITKHVPLGAAGRDQPEVQVASGAPVFQSNGSQLLLNDTANGGAWSVPSGALVTGSNNWDLDVSKQSPDNATDDHNVRENDPAPPVAVDDSFGVRAGALVTLPVMLNDSDPNGDVISIVPGSVTGLDPSFGTASIANSDQTITVKVAANAPPTATFRYTVTDGTTPDGRKSAPATVTLTVHPPSQNSPPVWCPGTLHCLVQWPTDAQVAQGGSLELPILRGWVDPDGDPMIANAEITTGANLATATVTPAGDLVFKPLDTALATTANVVVTVSVSDVHGAESTPGKPLPIKITPNPKLQVEDFGLMTAANVPLTVDPSSHIRGAVGSPQIVNASLPASASADIDIDSTGATFRFSASQPGSYPVTMTVKDSAPNRAGATATSTVRITVVDAKTSLISTAPVTVFVRPNTDTSVDVFSAVQNPTGSVLLLSNPRPHPQAGASLDVDVVGQAQLRVRGTAGATGSSTGLLGTIDYTVSDGSGAPGMTTQGVATVYMLPSTPPDTPVAINDAVTVRAGAQVDIPVLANDVARGTDLVELDPSSIRNASGARAGLAFASGSVLRYLAPVDAPAKPITVYYKAYSAGNPSREAQASVTITVLGPGSNRAPRPETLTGRVAAGATVRIPFDPYGVDPDGDNVVLDSITPPQHGTAQISADGTAIMYTALVGSEGQQSFQYRVRDSQGEIGVGTVMVGVLNQQADPAPVTFSDYVQVELGSGNKVVVQPTLNDVDPNRKKLTLKTITPLADADTPLYRQLAGLIGPHNGQQVQIDATPTVATLTYTYTVENELGDISSGLIVVDVVNARVPDWPVVADTVVDAQTRSQLADGVDVVDGKVSWGGGSVGALKLSLYQPADGVTLAGDGRSIKVAHVPEGGMLVPFELSGPDFTGADVSTFGFLRIPAASDVILALKDSYTAASAPEGGASPVVDLSKWITAPAGATLDFATQAATTGARHGSRCEIDRQGHLQYFAGPGQPWTDACIVDVQTLTQKQATKIAVPFAIIPKRPEPQLRPASVTASPGQPGVSVSLPQLATWPKHTATDIAALPFVISYHGSQFDVAQTGDKLLITAKDTASPGVEERIDVSVTGHPSATAWITLKVGAAASQRPVGGDVALSCSESRGNSCDVDVVGTPGEVNAFAHTPLKVVGIARTVPGCTGVTFGISGSRTVKATWADDAPGGTCTVPFAVQDAQGRRSADGAGGKVAFELKGFPAAPASVAQIAYTGTSATLAVTPGDAGSAYPAITGYEITMDGKPSVTCSVTGDCPPVGGLQNGQKHTFVARAINAVGASKSGPSTVAWAFAQPTVSGVKTQLTYTDGVTSPSTGTFDLTIPNTDASATGYVVEWNGNSKNVPAGSGPNATATGLAAPAGQPTRITVTPQSGFTPPPGDQVDATPWSGSVTTAGSPGLDLSGIGNTVTNDSITITGAISGDANGSDKTPAQPYLYIASESGAPSCSNTGGDHIDVAGPGTVSTSRTITGLTQFHTYQLYVCYTNEYGVVQKPAGQATAWNSPSAPTGWKYTIDNQPSQQYLIDYDFDGRAPTGGTVPDNYVAQFADPSSGGYRQQNAYSYPTSVWGQNPAIQVRYCGDGFLGLCTASADVNPADGSAPYTLRLASVSTACSVSQTDAGDSVLSASLEMQGDGLNGVTAEITAYSYLDASKVAQHVDLASPQQSVTLEAGETDLQITGYRITLPSGFGQPFTGGSDQITQDPTCTN